MRGKFVAFEDIFEEAKLKKNGLLLEGLRVKGEQNFLFHFLKTFVKFYSNFIKLGCQIE